MGLDELNSNGVRVAAYLAAAAVCACAALVGRRARSGSRGLAGSWMLLFGLMAVLGLAREVDLGPWVTAIGRHRAVIEGWYADRREIQFWSLWGVVGATALAAFVLLFALRRRAAQVLPAAVVASWLVGFLLVRAISFHDVDALLYRRGYRGLLLNTGCELGLLLAFVVCAGGAIFVSLVGPGRTLVRRR